MVSGAEAAFFSLTRAELATFKEEGTPIAMRIYHLMLNEKKLLATILIANNFVNVAAILVATFILSKFATQFSWNSTLQWVIEVLLVTAIILLFGEIVPKVFATKNRIRFVKMIANPFSILTRFFSLPAEMLIRLNRSIEHSIERKIKQNDSHHASLEDLRHAINLTTGEEHRDEKEILKGIVNFSNIPVKSIMRARVDVKAIEINMPLEDLVAFINEHNYSRFPVFEESLDHILGVIHIKDLLPFIRDREKKLELKSLLRDVQFVPETKKIDALLEAFKVQRSHMAVVVDEFGGTAGVVTLEDVIEEIFGEINDEFDSEDWVYTKVSEDTYIFEGRISLIDVKRILGLEDETFEDAKGDSDTLGGLILELHGKIPVKGDVIMYKHYELHVEGVSKNRITQVKMVIQEPQEEEA